MADGDPRGDDAAHIETIREILFGRQLSELEQRLAALEQRLVERLEAATAAAEARIGDLGSQAADDLAALRTRTDAMRAELEQQVDELGQLVARQRAELVTSVSEQIDALRARDVARDALARVLREAADQIDPD